MLLQQLLLLLTRDNMPAMRHIRTQVLRLPPLQVSNTIYRVADMEIHNFCTNELLLIIDGTNGRVYLWFLNSYLIDQLWAEGDSDELSMGKIVRTSNFHIFSNNPNDKKSNSSSTSDNCSNFWIPSHWIFLMGNFRLDVRNTEKNVQI